MDNAQNCDSHINIPLSQTYRSYFWNLSSLKYYVALANCEVYEKYLL
jgi:hypothetical protein